MPMPSTTRQMSRNVTSGENAEASAPAARISTSKPYIFLRPIMSATRPNSSAPTAEAASVREDNSET
jgi:hypothetical protein